MAHVQQIPLAYNTIYLIEDVGERVLIDTGPDYEGAWEAILVALGGRLPDRVIATHGHHDHASLGRTWQEAGVPVWLGAEDIRYPDGDAAAFDREYDLLRAFAGEVGAPEAVVVEAQAATERRRHAAHAARTGYPPPGSRPHWPTGLRYRRYHPDRLISTEEDAGAGLRVIPAPGHTPGNLVVVHPGEGWLFGGDQLLPDITPTPSVQSGRWGERSTSTTWRFPTLPAFCDSHEGLLRRPLGHCYPGHGEPFPNPHGRLSVDLAVVRERTAETLAAVVAHPGATLFALCETLYPRAARRLFWQIVPTVLGQLDLLEAEGALLTEGYRYYPASAP